MPATTAGWVALGAVTAGGAAVVSAVGQSKAAKEAKSEAKKVRLQKEREFEQMFQRDLEAGEYFEELSAKQMELQAQSANIRTLAGVIAEQRAKSVEPETRVFTLPAQKTQTPIQQINLAIDKLLRG